VFDNFGDTVPPGERSVTIRAKVTDSDGTIISKTDASPTGWWSSSILESRTIDLPVTMKIVQPGDEIVSTGNLDRIVGGLWSAKDTRDSWYSHKRMEFWVRICIDEASLEKLVELRTTQLQL
jgi:hypothetical protein